MIRLIIPYPTNYHHEFLRLTVWIFEVNILTFWCFEVAFLRKCILILVHLILLNPILFNPILCQVTYEYLPWGERSKLRIPNLRWAKQTTNTYPVVSKANYGYLAWGERSELWIPTLGWAKRTTNTYPGVSEANYGYLPWGERSELGRPTLWWVKRTTDTIGAWGSEPTHGVKMQIYLIRIWAHGIWLLNRDFSTHGAFFGNTPPSCTYGCWFPFL